MAERNGGFTLIRAARLIDGNGGPPVERGAVLLEGDTIRAAGPEETVVPPEGAPVEERVYESQTVLPGLIDSHVHLIGIGDGRAGDELTTLPDEVLTLQAARNARAHLYSGVTTVRDCGAKNRTTLELRRAVEMGITPAPRLVLAGRPMAIIGGHLSYFGIQATGPAECVAAVRQLIKENVDFIKITASGGSTRTSVRGPSFNVDELTAIVDEAHKFGRHAASHATDSQSISNALDAGIDTVIHGSHVDPDGVRRYRPDIAERLVERTVYVNPTIHQGRERIWQLERKAETQLLTEAEQVAAVDEDVDVGRPQRFSAGEPRADLLQGHHVCLPTPLPGRLQPAGPAPAPAGPPARPHRGGGPCERPPRSPPARVPAARPAAPRPRLPR